jgi:serine protease AprX
MVKIPSQIVEYFLLGRTRRDAIERYTLDGGVVTDVWLKFAEDISQPVRVLLAPCDGTTTIDMAHELHRAIREYRRLGCPGPEFSGIEHPKKRKPTAISPLSDYATATIYIDELTRVVLPLTRWWRDKRLNLIKARATRGDDKIRHKLKHEILWKLGEHKDLPTSRQRGDWATVEAAPIAALIGVFALAAKESASFVSFAQTIDAQGNQTNKIMGWIADNAKKIATAVEEEFRFAYDPWLTDLTELPEGSPTVEGQQHKEDLEEEEQEEEPPALVQRVFLDREAQLAEVEALSTIKADACERLFEYSCRDITWAIIDSGIAAQHPAFLDWAKIEKDAERADARQAAGRPAAPAPAIRPHRIKAAFDFTYIDRIRSLDLTENRGTSAFNRRINELIEDLARLQGQPVDEPWRVRARDNLRAIADQLDRRITPDWGLIEPLIWIKDDNGDLLPSDHGTHVAGVLGGEWWKENGHKRCYLLQRGVCPDIRFYDLRVIPARTFGSDAEALRTTEFAILGAIEFVKFLNTRAGPNSIVVHGVNISMSIPHDVRNYGCGATPICVACDSLVGSGVSVVAAAGNRGWNEQEIGFGTFVFCSITDPGNANEVITVGSTHGGRPHTYGVSYFSSRGPTGDGRIKPDLVAPGERISAPARGGALIDRDGTSFAAPYVSGAAAILMARNKEFIGKPREVKRVLLESATDLGRERYFQGHGLLDILRALQSI